MFLWNPMCLIAGNKQIQINKAKNIIWKKIKIGASFHSTHLSASSHFLRISLSSARLAADPCGCVTSAVLMGKEQDGLPPTPEALPLAKTNPETLP